MTGFEFGTIVLVRFPFTDQRGSKQRPAVVVSSATYSQARPDVIPMAVTSRLRHRPDFGEIGIDDWQAAGLLRDCLRTNPLIAIAQIPPRHSGWDPGIQAPGMAKRWVGNYIIQNQQLGF